MMTGQCPGICHRRLVLVRVKTCPCQPRHRIALGEVCPKAQLGTFVIRNHRCGHGLDPVAESIRPLSASAEVGQSASKIKQSVRA
jgi:hypothetical protein